MHADELIFMQSQAVEPVPDVFEGIRDKQASDDKTSDAFLEEPLAQKLVHTSLPAAVNLEDEPVEMNQDTRAPVGKDAGAAEHTGAEAAVRRGGWEGGVEDQGGVPVNDRERFAPTAANIEVPVMVLDEEAERLVDRALTEP